MDHNNGKVYKLWSDLSDCLYIGSTCQPLHKRLSVHKSYIKGERTKTHIAMKDHLESLKIELIESFPCRSREELNAREGEHYRNNRDTVLNTNIPGRTCPQWKQDNKQTLKTNRQMWNERNKHKLFEYNRRWKENNPERWKEISRKSSKEAYARKKALKDQVLEQNPEVLEVEDSTSNNEHVAL